MHRAKTVIIQATNNSKCEKSQTAKGNTYTHTMKKKEIGILSVDRTPYIGRCCFQTGARDEYAEMSVSSTMFYS